MGLLTKVVSKVSNYYRFINRFSKSIRCVVVCGIFTITGNLYCNLSLNKTQMGFSMKVDCHRGSEA